MNCKLVREEYMDRYLDKELTFEEIKELKAHLEGCPQCQKAFSTYKTLIQMQKARISFSPSAHGKQKLVKRIRQKKLLPYQLAGSVAVAFLCFFAVTAFIESRIINQRFEKILSTTIHSITPTSNASMTISGTPRNDKKSISPQDYVDPERILYIVNDGD